MAVPATRVPTAAVVQWLGALAGTRTLSLLIALFCLAFACTEPQQSGALSMARAYPPEPPSGPQLHLEPGDLDNLADGLRLGVSPYADEAQTRRDLAPLMAHLTATLGVRVELVTSSSYGDLVAAIVANRVDIAMLSPVSYVEAREQNPGIRLAARAISQGSPDYSAYIIVRRDDPAEQLADLRGRRMAWVDRLSGSGYLYPRSALAAAGLDPKTLFRSEKFYGTHDAALAAVLSGQADAAAVASGALSRTCKAAEVVTTRGIRVLHKCGRLPYDAVAVGSGIGPQAFKKIAWTFQGLNNCTAAGRRILADTWSISGWLPADDSVYDGVRDHLRRTGLGPANAAVALPEGASRAP